MNKAVESAPKDNDGLLLFNKKGRFLRMFQAIMAKVVKQTPTWYEPAAYRAHPEFAGCTTESIGRFFY